MRGSRVVLCLASAAIIGSCADAEIVGAPVHDAGRPDAPFEAGRPRDPSDAEDVTCKREDAGTNQVPPSFAGSTSPVAATPSEVAAGGSLFSARCAACHGREGKGDGIDGPADPRATDLTAVRKPDDYLFWRISEGGRAAPFCSGMPAFASLTQRSRWQLVVYIGALATPADAGPSDAAAD